MASFKNAGASLKRPESPEITFMSIQPVLSFALVLMKASKGGADAYGQLHSLIYSCFIYDQYANKWKEDYMPSDSSQKDSWVELSQLQCIVDQDAKLVQHRYHGRITGKAKLVLPEPSREPRRAARGDAAPRRLQGTTPAEYESETLALAEFIEVAYMVRCNLLHGSYDIRDDADATMILNTGLRFTSLVRWMIQNTAW